MRTPHPLSLSWLATAAALITSAPGCVDVPDQPTEAVPRATTLPGSCASGQGQVQLHNTARQVVTATITESDGRISTLTIPPGHDDLWNVAVGDTTITATAPGFRDPLLSTVIDVGCDALATTSIHPNNFRVPSTIVMTTPDGQATEGQFACGTERTRAAIGRRFVGRSVEYTLTCNEPDTARGTRSLTVVYPASAAVGGTAPEPMLGCLEHFAVYQQPDSRLPYFTADFSPFGLECQADMTPGGPPSFGYIGSLLFPLATGGDLAIVRYHAPTDPDLHDGYDTYSQETTLYSGETGNHVRFRYRNKNLAAAPDLAFKLQVAGEGSAPINPFDTCDGWFANSAPVEVQELSMSVVGSSPFEGTFTRYAVHLKGPAVYFVRVVPYRLDGYGEPACQDGVSNWVRLVVDQDDPEADNDAVWNANHLAHAAQQQAFLHKQGYIVTPLSYFAPVQTAVVTDPHKRQIITKPNPKSWPEGCSYVVDTSTPSKPWYKAAWDGVMSAIDFVNTHYEELKDEAIAAATASVPLCNSTCKGLLSAAMNDALGHLRIPSDLPNLDSMLWAATPYTALYLEYKVAGTFGLSAGPLSLFAQMTSMFTSKVTVSIAGGPDIDASDMYSWGKPDAAFHRRPAVLWVHIVRMPEDDQTEGNYFWLQDHNHIWKSRKVEIPPMPPGTTMTIPVFLEPAYKQIHSSSAFQSYNDAADHYYWQSQDYQDGAGIMRLSVSNALNTPVNPALVIEQAAGADLGTYGKVTSPWSCGQ